MFVPASRDSVIHVTLAAAPADFMVPMSAPAGGFGDPNQTILRIPHASCRTGRSDRRPRPLARCLRLGRKGHGRTAAGATSAPRTGTLSLQELAGVIDTNLTAKKSVKATVDQDGSAATITLSVQNGAQELEIQLPEDEDGAAMHLLNLKDGIYSKEDTAGKPWVKFPPNSKNPQGKIYATVIALLGDIVQSAQQKELLVAGGTLAGTAAEKVGTADTTHYTVRVDVPKALKKIDRKAFVADQWAVVRDVIDPKGKPEARPSTVTDAQADEMARKFGDAMKGQPATFEFWVDAQGVPHKYALPLPARSDTKGSMTFAEWGTAKITPPPADQVAVAPDKPFGTG
jgi:hypothetical protein